MRIRSRCILSVDCSPCTVFTSIGKNTITTTTAALDCQSNPNHITRIGAMPTIGSAATKLPTGSSPFCRNGKRSITTASTIAAPQPMTKPDSAPLITVCTKSTHRMSRDSQNRAAISDGAGNSTSEISNSRSPVSHIASKVMPKITGMT